MRFFAAIIVLFFALTASALDRITATVTFTNAPTTNGMTFTVNGSVRTWTNTVFVSGTQVLTNLLATGSKTNLVKHIGLAPFLSVTLQDTGPTNFTLTGSSGTAMSVSASAGYVSIVMSTQTVSGALTVRVPYTAEAAAQQTNIWSAVGAALNFQGITNALNEASQFATNIVGRTNIQTMSGKKTWTGSNYFGSLYANSPFTTNLIDGGNVVINGTLQVNSTLAFVGFASTLAADGNGFLVNPEGANPLRLGIKSGVDGILVRDGQFTNNVFVGNLFPTNTTHQSWTIFAKSNSFPAGSDVSFGRYANSSLANGNNAAVLVGTNIFIQVSGPSGAFTINGIQGGRDGKLIYLLNRTGFNMTIANDSGVDPTAANRIYTLTGGDVATTGDGCATLIYNAADSRWNMIAIQQ